MLKDFNEDIKKEKIFIEETPSPETEEDVYAIFRKRFREKREEKNLTFDQIVLMTGISRSNLQRYESGETGKIPLDAALKIEKALMLPKGYLLGYSEDIPSSLVSAQKAFIPLIVSTKGMRPVLTDNIMQVATVEGDVQKASYCYYMDDNSMTGARINKGDVIFIKSSESLENGDVGAFIQDDRIIIRKYFHDGKNHILCPASADFSPESFRSLKSSNVKIIGKVIAFQGNL